MEWYNALPYEIQVEVAQQHKLPAPPRPAGAGAGAGKPKAKAAVAGKSPGSKPAAVPPVTSFFAKRSPPRGGAGGDGSAGDGGAVLGVRERPIEFDDDGVDDDNGAKGGDGDAKKAPKKKPRELTNGEKLTLKMKRANGIERFYSF
jgi:hypothetical protein